MKEMEKKMKKIENNSVGDKQRQQRERVADDVGDDGGQSTEFPNFMALSKSEKLVFFESLHAARKKATESGNKITERFGTIHDEYLEYFGSVDDDDDDDDDGSESFEETSERSGIDEPGSDSQSRGNSPTRSEREKDGSGQRSSRPEASQTRSPRRKRPRESDSAAVKKRSGSFVTKLPKLKSGKSSKGENEERKCDTSALVKSRFETLQSDEKEIFFSILNEARDNILKESPDGYCEIVFMKNMVKNYDKPSEETPTKKSETPDRKKPDNKGNTKENVTEKTNNLRVKVDINSSDSERAKGGKLSKRKERSGKCGKQKTEGEGEKTKKGTTGSVEKDERSKATERKPAPSTDGLRKKKQREESSIVADRKPKESNVNIQKRKNSTRESQEACRNKRDEEEGKVVVKSERSAIRSLGGKQEKKKALGLRRKIQIGKAKEKTKTKKRDRSPKSERVEEYSQSTLTEEETEEVKEESKPASGENMAEATEPPTETAETNLENETEETKESKFLDSRGETQVHKPKGKREKSEERDKSLKSEQEEKDTQSDAAEKEKTEEVKEESKPSEEGVADTPNPPTETAEKVKTKIESIETFVDEFNSAEEVEDEGKDKTGETKKSEILRSQRNIYREKTEKLKRRERSPVSEQVEQDREQEQERGEEAGTNSRSLGEDATEATEPPTEKPETKTQSIETFFLVANFDWNDDADDETNDKTGETEGRHFSGSQKEIRIDKGDARDDSTSSGQGVAKTGEPKAGARSIETFKSGDDVEDGMKDKTEGTKKKKSRSDDSLSYNSFRYEFGVKVRRSDEGNAEGATPMGSITIVEGITTEVEKDISTTKTPSSGEFDVTCRPKPTKPEKRPTEKSEPQNLEPRLEGEHGGSPDLVDFFSTNPSSHSLTNDDDSVLQLWEELKVLKLSDSDCTMETENISGSRFSFLSDESSQNSIHLAEEKSIVVESEDEIQEEEEEGGRRPDAAQDPDLRKNESVIVVDGNAIEKIKNLVKALEKEAQTKLEVRPENINLEYNQLLLDYTDYLTRLLYLLTN